MKTLVFSVLYLLMVGCSDDDAYSEPRVDIDPVVVTDPVEEEIEEENEFMEDSLNLTYLALGDSYTIGQNVAVDKRWPIQLKDELTKNGILLDTVEIIAQTGWTTANLISAIEGRNFQNAYDMVSLLIGVNNQYQGKSITEYAKEFESLLNLAIGLAEGKRDHVFVLSIPDYSVTPFAANSDTDRIQKELQDFNEICKKITLEYGIAYIDITPISLKAKDDATLLANDGLHPSGKMYNEWVKLIYDDVAAIIK